MLRRILRRVLGPDMWLEKICGLPTPKDLGMSKSNALGSREFTPDQEGPMWEDYYDFLSKMYKKQYKRYKLIKDIDFWISVHIIMNIEEFIYFIKSNTYRKHHMLDLRQPKDVKFGHDSYRWGYIDVEHKLTYAVFNLVEMYINGGNHIKFSEEDLKDPSVKEQNEIHLKIKDLLEWWKIDRKAQHEEYDRLLKTWSVLHKIKEKRKNGEADAAHDKLHEHEKMMEEELQEKLIEVIKLKQYLWC